MIRTINAVDKSVTCIPTNPVKLSANTQLGTPILPAVRGDPLEYAGRYVQNNDPVNVVYYAIGHQCDTTNYNGILAPYQQFDASNFGDAVWVYSTSNVTVSTTILARKDLSTFPGFFNTQVS